MIGKKKKIIWLSALKGTWKDFVASSFFKGYQPLSISNAIKLESAKSGKYLHEDDKTIIKNDTIQELLEKELIDQNTMYDLEAYKQKFIGVPLSKLGDQDVLLKVNLYKNIKSLSTRQALTNYFQKEKKMGYIHVAELSFKEVKKTPGNVIITDIRTLLEVTYLLLNDWLLLNLYNSRSLDFYNNIEIFHFSEYESAAPVKGNNHLWFSIDITSRDSHYLSSVFLEVEHLFFSQFKGYSEDFKKKIFLFQEKILKDEYLKNIEKSLIKIGDSPIKYTKSLLFMAQYKKEINKIKELRLELYFLIKLEYASIFNFL